MEFEKEFENMQEALDCLLYGKLRNLDDSKKFSIVIGLLSGAHWAELGSDGWIQVTLKNKCDIHGKKR